jgi:OmpA-OmpF porin, OOP family
MKKLLALAVLSSLAFSVSANELFRDRSSSYIEEGVFMDVDHVSLIANGMTKDQTRALLGAPHFNVGMSGGWNYLLNFRTPGGDVQCQLRLSFADKRITSQAWDTERCAALFAPVVPVAAAPAPAPAVVPFRLQSDALFAFDSAELNAEGVRAVSVLAAELMRRNPQGVTVAGHTDRIGSGAYNASLSENRALTVRNALVSSGVPSDLLQVAGYGASQPRVSCPNMDRAALIVCLAPNRRVEVSAVGSEKPVAASASN